MQPDTTKGALIRRRVLQNTVTNYIGKLVTLGTGFLLTPFILRHLGATAYGLWILVGSVVAYGALLDFGIASAVTKYTAEYRARGQTEQAQSLLATALCLYAALGLVAIALSAIIAPIFPDLFNVPPDQRTTAVRLVLLSGVAVGISIPCATTSAVLRGLQRFDLTNLIGITGTTLSVVATVAVLLLGGGVLELVAIGIAITLIMQVPSIWFIRRIVPELRFDRRAASRQLVRTVASFSSSLFVVHVAGQLQAKTDEIVIGAFLPLREITPYAIARRLSDTARILTDQFMKVLMPLASELHAEDDHARLRALYIVSTRLTLASFLPIGGTLVILARPILTAWVGPAYADYAHLVLILALASLIDTSQWPAGSVLQGMARHQPLAIMAICSGLANLGLSIVLIGRFGVTGVALGTLIPTTVECLGFVMPYALRVIGVSAREALTQVLLPALLPAIPMAIVLYVLRQVVAPLSLFSIMAVAGAGMLVYLAGYLSVGASDMERQTYRGFALSTIRFARARLKRS